MIDKEQKKAEEGSTTGRRERLPRVGGLFGVHPGSVRFHEGARLLDPVLDNEMDAETDREIDR